MSAPTSLSDDFTQGNIITKLIRFIVPILGALILQAMCGTIDLLVVGQLGTGAGISAVAAGDSTINLVTLVITSPTMGITVLISRCLGEKWMNRVGSVIGGCICFFVVLTAIITVLLLASASAFVSWLNAPAPAYEMTIEYVRIYGAGIIFVTAYNVISGIFRRLGNSKLSLIFMSTACLVNIAGDLFLVVVLHTNVAGVTLATILAQAVSVILSLFIIRGQNLPFTITRQDLYFNSEIPVFLKLGTPLALQELLTDISFLILCAIINGIELETSSGYGIAQKVISFIMLIPSALMQSISAFMARNMDAGKEKRVRKAILTGMGLGASVGAVIFLISFFRGGTPTSVFTTNETYIIGVAEYLKGFSSEAILTCLVFSYVGYFNGHDMSLPIMVQRITASSLVRVPLSYLFSLKGNASLSDIGLAVPAASLYGTLFFAIYYIWYVRKRG